MFDSTPTGPYDPPAGDEPAERPQRIGRYLVKSILGQGGFGIVYLAYDERLQRLVAIKVPHRRLIARPEDAEPYLTEARTIASLEHPNIVPVYDVGTAKNFPCFIVSRFIEGTTLARKTAHERLSVLDATQLVATVAETLHYTHRQGLVHRDIKPGNILLDMDDKPYVADFGLALREENIGQGPIFAGTSAYMSPEQARGEAHRVDGRSDIFSLGVVYYELLTSRLPFLAELQEELLEQIIAQEPFPPRFHDETIPREADRICLKALAKRASDRYATAREMAEDLRHFLIQATLEEKTNPRPAAPVPRRENTSLTLTPVSSPAHTPEWQPEPVRIVPKGLRSFDAHDADFFLELLPGPRDRDGLPECVRFWKTRLEEMDLNFTFPVGLLYGPSGCGKSSLVKAGLLPRLSPDVLTVYVEADVDETETRLLNGLRRVCPNVPTDGGLRETLAAVRRGQGIPVGRKVLIVLDQLEQWLHARKETDGSELVRALRQCDGRRLQCLVMVRDDFWMAATRFMRELEVRLVEGQNSAAFDFFPISHAERVLAAYGRAFGTLPRDPAAMSKDQKRFLGLAVQGLAQGGKVVCVRLALFAEMLKTKPWTPATLKEMGGPEGAGVTFLEATFSSESAPPTHRLHQQAARSVLQALLPEAGSDIKGQMQPVPKLYELSGYTSRRRDFDELLRILDGELRLITPTDPEGRLSRGPGDGNAPPAARYYQLTHDFLVPAVREWLTRKQRETPAGRAQLLLAERAALWTAKREAKQLPTILEWLTIIGRTERAHWSDTQRALMQATGRRHLTEIVASCIGLAAVLFLAFSLYGIWEHGRREERANQLVKQLLTADVTNVGAVAELLEALPGSWRTRLEQIAVDESAPPNERLRSQMALVRDQPQFVPQLTRQLSAAGSVEYGAILQALQPQKTSCCANLWILARDPGTPAEQRFQAAAALAELDPDDEQWTAIARSTAAALVRVNLVTAQDWIRRLRPVRKQLLAPLMVEFSDSTTPEPHRSLTASILADYAADEPSVLTRLLQQADLVQLQALLPAFKARAAACVPLLQNALATARTAPRSDLRQWTRGQANAAAVLLLLNRPEAVNSFLGQNDAPDVRTALVDLLPRLLDLQALWGLQEKGTNDLGRQALLLAVDAYVTAHPLARTEQTWLDKQLTRIYTEDGSAAVHAGAELLLRKQDHLRVESLIGELRGTKRAGWRVTQTGHTLAVIRGPVEFQIGSPEDEPRRDGGEDRSLRRIPYTYEIGTHEVTVGQFLRLFPDHRYAGDVAPTQDCPMNYVSWYDVARYCRRLSEEEGIDEKEMIFPPLSEINSMRDLVLPENWLQRSGYRPPTEAEWEFACRGGTTTTRYFGSLDGRLPAYGWWRSNSEERCWPVGSKRPNPFGLFDMLGNVGEWCCDRRQEHAQTPDPEEDSGRTINPGTNRVFRGGTYQQMSKDLRSAKRDSAPPTAAFSYHGFRLARTVPRPG